MLYFRAVCTLHSLSPACTIYQDWQELLCRQLSCTEGRSAATWVDFSLFGHQLVCHQVKGYSAASSHNAVDGDPVPVPHFGLALSVPQFHDFAQQLENSGIDFIIKPHLRFEGKQCCAMLLAVYCRQSLQHCCVAALHKTLGAYCRSTRRAVHHVFQGPKRKCAGVQGHDQSSQSLCSICCAINNDKR